MRERREINYFSRNELEYIAKSIAKTTIVGSLFVGEFIEQSVQWQEDGGINVITTYKQGSLEDLAISQEPLPALPKKSKGKRGE